MDRPGGRVDSGAHTAMTVYLPMLVALVALLAGLAIGKAWERYKLRDGQWIDRRKARESPHFIVGLDLVVANQIDAGHRRAVPGGVARRGCPRDPPRAGQSLSRKGTGGPRHQHPPGAVAAPESQDARTRLHPAVPWPGLPARRVSSTARTRRSRKCCGSIPKNRHALIQLEKLHEEQHQWAEAYDIRQQLSEIDAAGPLRARDNAILAFLENELGDEASKAGDRSEASRRFAAAIERDRSAAPAYLSLGDVKLARRRRGRGDRRVGRPHRGVAGPGVSRVRPAAGGVRDARRAAAISRTLPPFDRRQPAGLAGAAGPGPPSQRRRRCQHRPRTALRGALAQPARPDDPPGNLAGAVGPRAQSRS